MLWWLLDKNIYTLHAAYLCLCCAIHDFLKKSHSPVAYITSLVDKSIDQSITRSVANHENQLRINDRRAI